MDGTGTVLLGTAVIIAAAVWQAAALVVARLHMLLKDVQGASPDTLTSLSGSSR